MSVANLSASPRPRSRESAGPPQKGFATTIEPLRHEPDPVVREQDRLPDVREVQQFLDKPIEPESPASVRGHAVPKCLEIVLEVLRVQALFLHPRQEDVVPMLPLASGGHLVSLVLEVEGTGVLGLVGLGHDVERLDGGRILRDEIEFAAFPAHRLPEEFLPFRVDVISVAKALPAVPQEFERFRIREAFQGQRRPFRVRLEEGELRLAFGPDTFDRGVDGAFKDREEILLSLDPGDLPVERGELRHVSHGVGRLRPEGRGDLVHPIEAAIGRGSGAAAGLSTSSAFATSSHPFRTWGFGSIFPRTATTLSRTTFDARLKRSASDFFLIVAWNVPSRWRTMRNAIPPRFRTSSTQPARAASLPWSAAVITAKDRNGAIRAENEQR